MRSLHSPAGRGFALVITLITIVLLTIMAVAFLASSSLDQATARAYSNKANAELAARTAVNTAIARLTDNLSTYSDSATAWDRVPQTGTVQYEGTSIYYRQQSPDATAGGTPPPMFALPLISGAKPVQIPAGNRDAALGGAFTASLDNTNSFDLNHARSANDLQGAIGAPTGAAARPEFRGQWINQTDSDNKVTSRYAYWMEDESFKANVNQMGVTPRGDSTLGQTPSEIPLQGLFKALGLQNFDGIANAIFNSRASFPNKEFYEYGAVDQASPTKVADNAKFESTIFSGALNLSRTGTKRINLNKVVPQSPDTTDPAAIRSQLDQIIKAITYQAPNFAQRFYRLTGDKNSLDVPDSGTPSDRTIYLNKIAANIRDYIDSDSQPTIVNNDSGLTVNIGAPPQHSLPGGGLSGANEVIAIGKEAVPLLQEYMLRVKLLSFGPRIGTSASYTIEIDHYLEFWNMGTKDITLASLGPNPFLRIANQFSWDAGTSYPQLTPSDYNVPLAGFANANGDPLVFAAGQATVITTDSTPLPTTLFTGLAVGRIFRPPANAIPIGVRDYSGMTNRKSGSELRLNSIPRPNQSPTAADLETELILGNANGVLDSFGSPSVYYMTLNIDNPNGNQHLYTPTGSYYFRASSLKGNLVSATPSEVGDPRTNGEQLSVTTSVSNEDQTAYKNEITATPPNSSTLTGLDTNFVDPSVWTDPAMNTPDAAHAPMVIANDALTSIGQLGDIFDPSRLVGAGGIRLSRGGGRTLRIGQPDDLWDGKSDSASREWTAWRLADIFSTSDSSLATLPAQLDGRINVNGVNRDEGVALKSALDGYVFQPTPLSGPQVAGVALGDPAMQKLVDELKARLTNDATNYPQFATTSGPLFERGEVSELPIFNTGTDLTGVDMSKAYDRGREELFRRIAELITTRGNIFTVYAVGQSLIPPPTGSAAAPTVTATSETKVTFRLDPHWAAGPPSDPFDPTQTTRFTKPDSYAIKILYVGN